MNTNKHLATVAVVISLAACGGGGGDGDESGPPRFVTWKDSSNGIVVKDAADEGFGVETLSRSVVHIAKNNTLGGLTVDGNAQVIAKGAPIGLVLLGTATNGSQIAIFKCSDGTAMRLTISADGSNWSHSCSNAPPPPPPPPPPAPPTAPTYTSWNGSSNGVVVLDGSNRRFAVNATNRVVHDFNTHTSLNGLTAQNGGNVFANGTLIGSIVLTPSNAGGNVAVFQCANGRNMEITVTQTQWLYDCNSGSGGGHNPPKPPNPETVVRGEVINHGPLPNNPYNRYQVTVQNTGNVNISCTVIFDYEYPRNGKIESDRHTLNTGRFAPNETRQVIMGMNNMNITFKSFSSPSCQQWLFG